MSEASPIVLTKEMMHAKRVEAVRKSFFMDKRYAVIRDPRDPHLYAPNKKIKNPQDPKTSLLVETLCAHHIIEGGLGLAAPQIGWNAQVCVVQPPDMGNMMFVFFNPRIIGAREFLPDEKGDNIGWFDNEACISHPGVVGEIARFKKFEFIASTYTDPVPRVRTASGWIARILQHEIDHLNMTLWTDRKWIRNLHSVEGMQTQMDAMKRGDEEGYADVESDG